MTPPFSNSYWLEPDRILCGEYPRDIDDSGAHAAMASLLSAGVRVFVDLTEEGELKSYRGVAAEVAGRLDVDATSLEFHRHPIRDVSVPASPETMREALRTLRLARHRGLVAYLHCWGGRGRTGTVAACFLRELLGLGGDGALALLRERWGRCAKSATSESPETAEQRGYVRAWNPLWSREDRFRDAILGAAVGDALGVPVEFAPRSSRRSDPVEGMRAYGTHHQPAGTWSDDTSMILATMAGWRKGAGFDPEATMREFSRWLSEAAHTPHGEVFDVGGATSAAIHRYEAGVPALQCGGRSESSNGNGSLMRILPVALACADDPSLVDLASTASALTHAHERSRLCCAFFCLVAGELMHGEPLRAAVDFAWRTLEARWDFSVQERPRFEALRPDRLFAREEISIRSGGHVVDTLEAALWVNGRHSNYREAVLHAVNLGDDTDTTACVAGALAGLIHGIGGIPSEWLDVLVKRGELERAAGEFALAAG